MDLYYFGPEGTFTHQAAKEFAKLHQWPEANLQSVSTISDALGLIQGTMRTGAPAFACIPLENSIQGSVTASWDGLGHKGPVSLPHPQIVSALRLSIQQNLLVKNASVPLTNLRTVYSHPQALAQCRDWLSRNLPKAAAVNAESTAAAAKRVAESEDSTVAAIGPEAAAQFYKLHVANTSIEDVKNNTTRFGLVGDPLIFKSHAQVHTDTVAHSKQTLSLLLTQVTNQPGGLSRVLKPFSDSHFNLNRIESRPVGTHFGTYVFYIDVEWDPSHSKAHWGEVETVLSDLGVQVKVLGHFSEF